MGSRSDAGEALTPLLVERLAAGQAASLCVTGHSMTPCIRAGDVVTLEPLRGQRPRLGQILAVTSAEGRLLIHRLVGWRNDLAQTRGDVAAAADIALPLAALLGRVTRIERGERRCRLGLGWERVPIAWLSRVGLLRLCAKARERLRAQAGDSA